MVDIMKKLENRLENELHSSNSKRAAVEFSFCSCLFRQDEAKIYPKVPEGSQMLDQTSHLAPQRPAAGTDGARRAPPKFRFIDLFAGIGGIRRGFEPLGGK